MFVFLREGGRTEKINSPNPQNRSCVLLLEAETKTFICLKVCSQEAIELFCVFRHKIFQGAVVMVLMCTGSWGVKWGTQSNKRTKEDSGPMRSMQAFV